VVDVQAKRAGIEPSSSLNVLTVTVTCKENEDSPDGGASFFL
jgi:hypothetical protein